MKWASLIFVCKRCPKLEPSKQAGNKIMSIINNDDTEKPLCDWAAKAYGTILTRFIIAKNMAALANHVRLGNRIVAK